ncbi:hypothetical protein A9988_11530 [Acinetobacter calcoaceticus]|nr:hypothetical protein A9988_11530 [Acinetobacter calcoaceticus]
MIEPFFQFFDDLIMCPVSCRKMLDFLCIDQKDKIGMKSLGNFFRERIQAFDWIYKITFRLKIG